MDGTFHNQCRQEAPSLVKGHLEQWPCCPVPPKFIVSTCFTIVIRDTKEVLISFTIHSRAKVNFYLFPGHHKQRQMVVAFPLAGSSDTIWTVFSSLCVQSLAARQLSWTEPQPPKLQTDFIEPWWLVVSNWGHSDLAGGEPTSPRRKADIVYPSAAIPWEDLFLVTHLGGSIQGRDDPFIEKSLSLNFTRVRWLWGGLKQWIVECIYKKEHTGPHPWFWSGWFSDTQISRMYIPVSEL